MNRIFYFLIFTITITAGCRRDHSAPDNTKEVYERLHGKYKATSSVSSEAVDVNMDGIATNDILSEIPDLQHCNLEIRIVAKNNFLLVQSWPEQYIAAGSLILVNYVRQGVVRTFLLNANQTTILVNQDTISDPVRFPMPASVSIEGIDTIKIVFSKKLYTSAGWKTTSITTVYNRYTMTT